MVREGEAEAGTFREFNGHLFIAEDKLAPGVMHLGVVALWMQPAQMHDFLESIS
jgi:hypothetical protein